MPFNCSSLSHVYSLQTAYNLVGSGLLPWNGSRAKFARAYTSLLTQQNVGLTNPNLTYVGSVVRHWISQCALAHMYRFTAASAAGPQMLWHSGAAAKL